MSVVRIHAVYPVLAAILAGCASVAKDPVQTGSPSQGSVPPARALPVTDRSEVAARDARAGVVAVAPDAAASRPGGDPEGAPGATPTGIVPAPPPKPQAGPPPEPQAGPSPAPETSDGYANASILQSATFRRQFTASYIAETDIEPSLNDDEREVLSRAIELLGEKKFSQASAVLSKACTGRHSAVLDFTRAHVLVEQDMLTDAAAAYQSAIDKHPKFRRAWQGLGQVWFRLGEHARLVPALTKVIGLGGGSGLTYGLLGVAYSKLGRHLSAESAFRMATLLDPQTKDWKMGLAESFFNQQRFAEVVALCGSLLAEQPDSVQLWLIQANAYVGLQQPQKAAENFELVDRLGGSTVEILHLLGDIYVNEKLLGLAANAYLRGMEKDPKGDPKRGLRAAKVLAARGGLEATRLVADRLEALFGDQLGNDDRKELLRLRARVALAEGGNDQQAVILEQIIKLDPLDGEALILLGRYHGRNDRAEQALFCFERAADVPGFESRAKLAQAEMLVRQRKYRAALPLLRRSQELDANESVREFLAKVERAANNR
jgi:tetratricopeptide (TPR) repeat protein